MYRLLPALAIALTVGCATPPAEKPAGGAEGNKQPWWQLSQYSRGPVYETPEERYRKRPGVLSGEEGGFVLFRKGEGVSGSRVKPAKVRR